MSNRRRPITRAPVASTFSRRTASSRSLLSKIQACNCSMSTGFGPFTYPSSDIEMSATTFGMDFLRPYLGHISVPQIHLAAQRAAGQRLAMSRRRRARPLRPRVGRPFEAPVSYRCWSCHFCPLTVSHHLHEFRGEPSVIRVDVTPQHGALAYVILDVLLPLFIRPHLPVHSLLPEVTIEVVRQQLGGGHRPSVLGVIAGELVAFVKVFVENGISQNGPVEFQLPRGYGGARLRVESFDEHTKTPRNDDETKAGDKNLHKSEENGIAFVARHSRGSFF